MEHTRDQIATQLGDLFNDPANYMKKRAEDLMFQIMANWMLQAEQTNPRLAIHLWMAIRYRQACLNQHQPGDCAGWNLRWRRISRRRDARHPEQSGHHRHALAQL